MNVENVKKLSNESIESIGDKIGIDWEDAMFSIDSLRQGIIVEMEHGTRDRKTNVTDDNVYKTAKIAWAHLNENTDYYSILKRVGL